jgi:hypothetical protein
MMFWISLAVVGFCFAMMSDKLDDIERDRNRYRDRLDELERNRDPELERRKEAQRYFDHWK